MFRPARRALSLACLTTALSALRSPACRKSGGRVRDRPGRSPRKWVGLTCPRLPLPDGRPPAGLVAPQALYVGEHLDYLLAAQSLSECRHRASEARKIGVFLQLSALADDPVQKAVRMVPGVAISVQGRWGQRAILVRNVPVWSTLSVGSMANRAVGGKDTLSGPGVLAHRRRAGRQEDHCQNKREQKGLRTWPMDRPAGLAKRRARH